MKLQILLSMLCYPFLYYFLCSFHIVTNYRTKVQNNIRTNKGKSVFIRKIRLLVLFTTCIGDHPILDKIITRSKALTYSLMIPLPLKVRI